MLDDNDENGPAWSDRDYTYEEVCTCVQISFVVFLMALLRDKTLRLNCLKIYIVTTLYVESNGISFMIFL